MAEFIIPDDADEGRCRSCGAGVIWITTQSGAKMPISAKTVKTDALGVRRGMTHFADCPNAKRWSGKGRKQPEQS